MEQNLFLFFFFSLLFLSQAPDPQGSANSVIGRIRLQNLPPFVNNCPSSSVTVLKIPMAKANVTNIAVHRGILHFTIATERTLFLSRDLGKTVHGQTTISSRSNGAPGSEFSSMLIHDPVVVTLMGDGETKFTKLSYCANTNQGRRGDCEYFCFGKYQPGNRNITEVCACPDGMRLLSDKKSCAPNLDGLDDAELVFALDDYRHDIYSLNLRNLGNFATASKEPTTTYSIFPMARPYAMHFFSKGSVRDLYFSDFYRFGIYKMSPMDQIHRETTGNTPIKPMPSEELFMQFADGDRCYGMDIDYTAEVMFYTIRDRQQLFAANLKTKQNSTIKDFGMRVYGVLLDPRPEKMHVYVAVRNITTKMTVTNSTAPNGRSVLRIQTQTNAISGIMRCNYQGDNCWSVVSFAASGTDVAQIPWVYEMSIDFKQNLLYFTTGQNRSVMHINIGMAQSAQQKPVIFIESDDDTSFFYGLQLYKDWVLATDWSRGGIQVYDKSSTRRIGSLGEEYLIGLNALSVFSRSTEQGTKHSNEVCLGNRCSHVCVPVDNKTSRCTCPGGAKTVDGFNCPGVPMCEKPNEKVGLLDPTCIMRHGAYCALTCKSGSVSMVSCNLNENGTAEWCVNLADLCDGKVKTNDNCKQAPSAASSQQSGSSSKSFFFI